MDFRGLNYQAGQPPQAAARACVTYVPRYRATTICRLPDSVHTLALPWLTGFFRNH